MEHDGPGPTDHGVDGPTPEQAVDAADAIGEDPVLAQPTDEDAALGWILLHDPAWDPRTEEDDAPPDLIAGGWPILAGGDVGAFHVNELHRPDPDDPDDADPDPVGAALQLVAEDRAPVELALMVLRDSAVHVGTNADGRPLVVRSLDERLCLVVATCWERRAESDPPEWEELIADELVAILPPGTDVLFNPAGPHPIRLSGTLVREALTLTGIEAGVALAPALRSWAPDARPVTVASPVS